MGDLGRGFAAAGQFIWETLLKMQRIVMLLTICISASAIMAEVLMRYIFKISIVGIEELAAYIAFWLYFIGASYGTYERSHIKAELTHLLLKNPRSYAISRALTSFISFALSFYAIILAYRYAEWGIRRMEQSNSTFLGSTYPVFYFQFSLLAGFVLMCFYFLVEFLQWIKPILKNETVHSEMMSARKDIKSWI
jgi:TRAP-type C4-dicarboxylate transport system permease small subunit